MKVLHIITSLYTGGAEKLLIDSIPIYKQKGIDVYLLLLNGNETPFYKQLKSKNITLYKLTKGNIRKVYNPLLTFQIIPYLKKYDIIHVHLFPALYWTALAKYLSRSKVKLVFTEHSTNNKRITKKGVWRLLDKLVYKQYNKIGTITSEVDTVIKTHLETTSDKFRVINNGIDISQYSNAKGCEKEDKNSKVIIQVASFSKPKDQPTLIRALQYLPQNIVVQFIGDGVLRKQCEQLVDTLGLSDRISFLGVRTDVPTLLKSADIVVMSSNYEGLSLSMIEGMASGNPLVASAVPGLKDIVSGTGLLFEKGNERDLAEKIMSLLNDDELYKKIALQCSNKAKQYDINTMVDKYIELYKETVNE